MVHKSHIFTFLMGASFEDLIGAFNLERNISKMVVILITVCL